MTAEQGTTLSVISLPTRENAVEVPWDGGIATSRGIFGFDSMDARSRSFNLIRARLLELEAKKGWRLIGVVRQRLTDADRLQIVGVDLITGQQIELTARSQQVVRFDEEEDAVAAARLLDPPPVVDVRDLHRLEDRQQRRAVVFQVKFGSVRHAR